MPAARSDDLLAPFLEEPGRCALLMDIDGTLAPIVERPHDARVPPEITALLAELAERCAVVACVTGRRAAEARAMVGADGLVYIGTQGYERLLPGDAEPRLDPVVAPHGQTVSEFLAALDWEPLRSLGVRPEDKGPIQVLHWRGAPDEARAEEAVDGVAEKARERGLTPLWGRKVLELRPVDGIDKGSAVRGLLTERAPLAAALFAGDDRTDLDAFRALGELADAGVLGAAVRVGVASREGPPEIRSEAELVVSGTEGVAELLRALAS